MEYMQYMMRVAFAVLTISAVLASGMHDKTAGRAVEPDMPQRWLLVDRDRSEGPSAKLLTKEGLEDWENGIKDNCKILASEVKDKVAEKTRASEEEVSNARLKFEAAARLILKETASRARQIEEQMQALEVATAHGQFNGKTSVTPLGKCCCAGKSEEDAECSWHTHSELVGSLDKFQCPPEAVFEYTDLVKPTLKNSTSFVDARSIDQLLGACVRSPRWQERIHSSGQLVGDGSLDLAQAPGDKARFATVTDPEAQKVTDIIARSLSPLTGGTDAWLSEDNDQLPFAQDGIQQDGLPPPEHDGLHVPIRNNPVPNHQEDELSSAHDGEGEQVVSDSDTDSRGGRSGSQSEPDSDDRSGSEDAGGGGSPSSSEPDSDDDSSSNSGGRSQDQGRASQGRPQSGLPGPGSQQDRPHSGGSHVHPDDADLERELAMSDDSEDENKHPRSHSNAQPKQWSSITVKLSIKPAGHNESSFSQAAATLTSKAAVLRPARSKSHEA